MKVIVVGAGEVGYHIANKLARENKDVVVIDRNEDRLRHVSEALDVQTLLGSGASPTLLRQAGIQSARMIVAVTDSDETNLVACLMARILSPATTRIARIRNQDFFEIEELKQEQVLGLSLAINPESEVVKTILGLLEVPGALDVIDFAGGLVRLIGLKIRPESKLVGLTMIHLGQLEQESPILIAAIHRNNTVIIPRGQTKLEAGDLVYVATRHRDVDGVLKFFGMKPWPTRMVFIAGGGQVGAMLAEHLEKLGVKVKLVDRDGERCRHLGEVLNKTIILKGDATDQGLLLEENVADADFFVALTNDEEENVLACLLARQLGVRRTITRVNKFAYIPLVTAIGLEVLVSSRLSAVSAILRNIRRGKVVSAAALKGEDAEVIEFEALPTSDIVGRRLAKANIPKQALIAAIVRGVNVIIPTGDTVIDPGDRVIIITRREAIHRVEKALTVKLEYF